MHSYKTAIYPISEGSSFTIYLANGPPMYTITLGVQHMAAGGTETTLFWLLVSFSKLTS